MPSWPMDVGLWVTWTVTVFRHAFLFVLRDVRSVTHFNRRTLPLPATNPPANTCRHHHKYMPLTIHQNMYWLPWGRYRIIARCVVVLSRTLTLGHPIILQPAHAVYATALRCRDGKLQARSWKHSGHTASFWPTKQTVHGWLAIWLKLALKASQQVMKLIRQNVDCKMHQIFRPLPETAKVLL